MVAPKFSPVLDFLRNLVVFPPVDADGFQLFGLRLDPWHRRITGLFTLGEPLACDLAIRVMELRHDARSVWVMNESDRPILLPAGERLPGVRGRRLRVSLVVGAQETLKLHADLLEDEPPAAGEAVPSTPLLPRGAVYTAESRLQRNATGAVLARGGRILCLHLFDRRDTLRRILPEILRGCSGAEFPATGNWSQLTIGDVEAWIERVSSLRVQVRAAFGLGREVLIDDAGLRGRCLLLEEGPVHAAIAVAAPPAPLVTGGLPDDFDEEDELPEAIPPATRHRESPGGHRYLPAPGLPAEAPPPGGRQA